MPSSYTGEIRKKVQSLVKEGKIKTKYHYREYLAYQRGLGFVPLNSPEQTNDIAHHIDNNRVVFIPDWVHGRCWGKSLDDHRNKVREWLKKNNKELSMIVEKALGCT